MPRTYTLFCLVLSFVFVSCHLRETDSNVSYTVPLTTFEDILTVTGVVEPLRSTTLTCPRQVDGVVIALVEDGTMVNEGDTVCVLEDQNVQNRYDQVAVDLENAEANFEKVKADLALQYALLEAQVQNNEAETLIAGLDSLQMAYSTPNQRRVKTLELEKRAIEKAKYEKKLEALRVIQQSEVRKLELEIQRLRNQLESTKEILEKLVIRSPVTGLATRPMYWISGKALQVGDNVWGNMPLVVIPEMDEMKVKIMAPERDFKVMNVNDSVSYTFDAMPGVVAGGKITKKVPVGQPLSRDSRVKVFEVEASIDTAVLMPEPGFTANCHVRLRSEPNVLVVPQIALFDEDSIKVVYVRLRKGYERREVRTGISSRKETVVSEGLEREEIIALTRPKANMIKSEKLLPDTAKTTNSEQLTIDN